MTFLLCRRNMMVRHGHALPSLPSQRGKAQRYWRHLKAGSVGQPAGRSASCRCLLQQLRETTRCNGHSFDIVIF